MILGVQILGVLFTLFMIYLTFLHQKRNEFNVNESFFWIFSWVMLMIITIFPNVLSPFVRGLQLHRIMDLLTILGFLCVIGLLFNNYLKLRKTDKKIEKVVRSISLHTKKQEK